MTPLLVVPTSLVFQVREVREKQMVERARVRARVGGEVARIKTQRDAAVKTQYRANDKSYEDPFCLHYACRFGDVARVFQGQFVQGIFRRLDVDGDGEVRLPEFLVNAARLMRPVSWERTMREAAGFPGLGALVVDDGAEDIRHFVASLQTGDIILSKIDDDMGRYLQFAMDAPWSHTLARPRRVRRPR